MRLRRDILGSLVGLLVFLGGIALLLFTFHLAYEMFTVPPPVALDLRPNKPVDLESAGSHVIGAFFRVLLLVVMALVGSLIANRGIQLYADSRGHIHDSSKTADPPDEVTRFVAEGGNEVR